MGIFGKKKKESKEPLDKELEDAKQLKEVKDNIRTNVFAKGAIFKSSSDDWGTSIGSLKKKEKAEEVKAIPIFDKHKDDLFDDDEDSDDTDDDSPEEEQDLTDKDDDGFFLQDIPPASGIIDVSAMQQQIEKFTLERKSYQERITSLKRENDDLRLDLSSRGYDFESIEKEMEDIISACNQVEKVFTGFNNDYSSKKVVEFFKERRRDVASGREVEALLSCREFLSDILTFYSEVEGQSKKIVSGVKIVQKKFKQSD